MMTIFKSRYNSIDSDSSNSIFEVLNYFMVKYTKKSVIENIENHVEYPSMLSIKDILSNYGVDSAAVYKSQHSYSDFETPFITTIQKESWSSPAFVFVHEVKGGLIKYFDPLDMSYNLVSFDQFEDLDTGVILLLDGENRKDEENYLKNKTAQVVNKIYSSVPLLLLFAICIYIFISSYFRGSAIELTRVSMYLTTTVGLILSVLLLWHDIDEHDPFIKEVCGGHSKRLSCDAVLNSKGAVFLGALWSVWGGAYFFTFFIVQLLMNGDPAVNTIYAASSLLVSPYIFYSVYYQSRIVKQWCRLCLGIQVTLLINFLFSCHYFTNYPNDSIYFDWSKMFAIFFMFCIVFLLVFFLVPVLKRARKNEKIEKKWKRLRYHPDVFQSLLVKGKEVSIAADDLGILIGNPNASNEIIKVCNPYCAPCSKAHPVLEQIVRGNPDVKLRIVFTADGTDKDIMTAPVLHFMAIQATSDSQTVVEALDDWYLSTKKNYELFAQKYPMRSEMALQKDSLRKMSDWCNSMKIRATPTIFINGYELPNTYSVSDLRNFF